MRQENKESLIKLAKVIALIIWGFVAVITSAAVWGAAAGEQPKAFVCVVAGISLIANAVAIYLVQKQLFKTEK